MTAEKEHYYDVLGLVPIFAAIDNEKLLKLYEKCEIRICSDGEFLIEEDSDVEEIYIVLEGEVSILLHRNGKQVEVARMGVGSCLGETSVIGIQHRTADVKVVGNTTFLILTRVTLMNLFSEDLELFALLVLNIARELARRLKNTDHFIEIAE